MSDERRRTRQFKAVQAGQLIRQRLGALDTRDSVEHVRIASLAAIAETRALWRFLLESGLATEAQREDYLDKGYQEILAQVEASASKIYVEGADGRA
jgi:hypothetical protein